MSSDNPVKLTSVGGGFYEVDVDGRTVGQVRPGPRSTASKPSWVAYRLNEDGYLGPLGTGGWGRPTRREAVAQLLEATSPTTPPQVPPKVGP